MDAVEPQVETSETSTETSTAVVLERPKGTNPKTRREKIFRRGKTSYYKGHSWTFMARAILGELDLSMQALRFPSEPTI
jgi:hypothetical protein